WNNAKRIAAMMKAAHPDAPLDVTLVSVAALMHDIGRPQELADQGKTNHAVYGAELCMKLLPELGVVDVSYCMRVADCIRSHRFRKLEGNAEPVSLESTIVYDADKLDSIGAIGIGRSFHFAGRTGARVHNTAEEALSSGSYSREDSAYREYLVKLRKIRERMLTDAGRQLAEKRHAFMVAFFDELNEECFGA
ncbi:MAG: HD domain-containing protein, partial [Victivallales bacterium]|nr:HD domain-containing protein [Victivallales bacterium]